MTASAKKIDDPAEFGAMPDADRACLLLWIELAMQPAKTVRTRQDSYNMKHDFEYEGGFYVANGEFKGAMLAAGYEPEDPRQQNWFFKVKPRGKPLHWTQEYYRHEHRRPFHLEHLTPEQQRVYADARQATGHGYYRENYRWLAPRDEAATQEGN